ncbi:MAG: DNA replication initiation control protein YabA [Sporolactobacillus sp.]
MEKKDIFSQVSRLEEQIAQVHGAIADLKKGLVDVLEENQNLIVENRHLRERLEVRDTKPAASDYNEGRRVPASDSGEAYENLLKLYNEGFHICNLHYGRVRKDGDCLFCVEFLNMNKRK